MKKLTERTKQKAVRAIISDGKIDKIRCAKYYRPYADLYKETLGLYFCHE